MNNKFSIIKIFTITFLLFILIDFLAGTYIYNKFVRSDFIDVDTSFAERDNIYDHKFVISPLFPNSCKFEPTCSSYFIECLKKSDLSFLSVNLISN